MGIPLGACTFHVTEIRGSRIALYDAGPRGQDRVLRYEDALMWNSESCELEGSIKLLRIQMEAGTPDSRQHEQLAIVNSFIVN
jgi:hypothetical protein